MVSSGTPDYTVLIDIPSWFPVMLHTRTLTGSSAVPTKPSSSVDSHYAAYATMDGKFVAYITGMQAVLTALASVDTGSFEEQVEHVVNLQTVFDIIGQIKTLMVDMNDKNLGSYMIDTTCSGVEEQANSFLMQFPTYINAILNGVLQNVIYLLGPGTINGIPNWNNKFQ